MLLNLTPDQIKKPKEQDKQKPGVQKPSTTVQEESEGEGDTLENSPDSGNKRQKKLLSKEELRREEVDREIAELKWKMEMVTQIAAEKGEKPVAMVKPYVYSDGISSLEDVNPDVRKKEIELLYWPMDEHFWMDIMPRLHRFTIEMQE